MARTLQLLTLSVALMGAMAQYQVPLQGSVWNKTFTYLAGTLDWASNPAWTCNGKSQSPISIDTTKTLTAPASVVPDLEKAFIAALPRGLLGSVSNVTLSNKNGGYTFGFGNWSGPSQSILRDLGTQFGLNDTAVRAAYDRWVGTPLQMHLHGIAENVIDGALHPTELHIVRNQSASQCQNDPSCFAVYGIHFALPKSTYTNATLPIMAELLDLYDEVENTGPKNALVGETINLPSSYSIDLAKLFPADTSYFRWNGSLTGPPCTEGLEWTMFKAPQLIDVPDVQKLQIALGQGMGEIQTNRYPQPLNGRPVYFVQQQAATVAGRRLMA